MQGKADSTVGTKGGCLGIISLAFRALRGHGGPFYELWLKAIKERGPSQLTGSAPPASSWHPRLRGGRGQRASGAGEGVSVLTF
jgi:hypothetical protein